MLNRDINIATGDNQQGSGGFARSLNAGFHLNQEVAAKTNLNINYFVSHLDATRNRLAHQQQVFGSELAALSQVSSSRENINLRHSVDLYAKLNLGEGHDMRIRAELAVGSSTLDFLSAEKLSSDVRPSDETGYGSRYDEETDNFTGEASLVWRKRLSEEGRSIVLESDIDLEGSDALGNLESRTGFVTTLGDLHPEDEEWLQRQEEASTRLAHSHRISLTQPLAEDWMLEGFVRHRDSRRERDKTFYDIVDGRQNFNNELSESFEQSYQYWTTGLELSVNSLEHTWISGGITLQRVGLNGFITGSNQEITSAYTHVLPWARLRQRLGEGKQITLRYSGDVRTPSITDLQPFADNTNPLRIYIGNPNLRPEYSHTLRGSFRLYDQFSFVGFYTSVRFSLTQHDIVTTRTVDELLRQTRSRVNADKPSWSTSGTVGFETPIRPLGIKVDLSNTLSIGSGIEFINTVGNTNRRLTNRATVSVRNRAAEVVDIEVNYTASYNDNRYSLNTEANQSYLNGVLGGEATWYPTEKLKLNASVFHRIFDQDVFADRPPANFPDRFDNQDNITLLNASVSYLLLKERGEIRLELYDIFDNDTNVNYTNSSTYIEEEHVRSLGRYVMMKFIYRPRGKSGAGFFGF